MKCSLELLRFPKLVESLFPNNNALYSSGTSDIPEDFMCPITRSIMIYPHMDTDGVSYEESCLNRWVSAHNTSPLSRTFLFLNDIALRNFIVKWRAENLCIREETVE